MKIAIKFVLVFVTIANLFGIPHALAVDEKEIPVLPTSNQALDTVTKSLQLNLPIVTLLPDSPLYQLKTTWEAIQLFLSKTPEQKIETLIQMSQTRLAEALQLHTKNNDQLANKTLDEFTVTLNKAKDLSNDMLQRKGGADIFKNKLQVEESKYEMLNLITGEYHIRRMK